MKIKDGFIKRKIHNKTVVVPTGDVSKDFHGMIELNETAEFIWDRLLCGKCDEDIANELSQTFDVPGEKALTDIKSIIDKLSKAGLLTEK